MSKECPGKYHGSAVKYIADDEKYCVICQQEIALKRQKTKETVVKGLKTVGKGVLALAGCFIGGAVSGFVGSKIPISKGGGNAGAGGTPPKA